MHTHLSSMCIYGEDPPPVGKSINIRANVGTDYTNTQFLGGVYKKSTSQGCYTPRPGRWGGRGV